MINIKKIKLNSETRFQLVLVFFIFLSYFSIQNNSKKIEKKSLNETFKNQIVLFNNNKKIFSTDNTSAQPILWQDQIFYEQTEENNTGHLMSYDLTTGNFKSIYKNQVGKNIGDIDVIDDVLYFSISNSNSKEPLYFIDLFSSNLEPTKLHIAISQKIEKFSDKYLLIENSSNNQICYILDSKNKTITLDKEGSCTQFALNNQNISNDFLGLKLPKGFSLIKFD